MLLVEENHAGASTSTHAYRRMLYTEGDRARVRGGRGESARNGGDRRDHIPDTFLSSLREPLRTTLALTNFANLTIEEVIARVLALDRAQHDACYPVLWVNTFDSLTVIEIKECGA